MPAHQAIAKAALLAGLTVFASACRTGAGDDAALAGQERLDATPEPALIDIKGRPSGAGGYFVAVPAVSTSPDVAQLYDKLFDGIDALRRKQARASGELSSYVAELDATGFTSLAAGDDEIECDREKCLLKLTGRVVAAAGEGAAQSLPGQLTAALELAGVKPAVKGAVKTFAVGDPKNVGLACEQRGQGTDASWSCRFNLDGAPSSPAAFGATGERGRLASCSLSPGVVRAAEEAKDALDGGGLLKLASGPSDAAPAVGYLRYSVTGDQIELVDFYLCGDLSHDSPRLASAAKTPRAWIPRGAGVGSVATLEPARQDDAEMRLRATVVQESDAELLVEVKFELVPDARAGGVEVYGDDRFFVKLAKAWVK